MTDTLPAVVKEFYQHTVNFRDQEKSLGVTSILRMEDNGLLTVPRLIKIFNAVAEDFPFIMASDIAVKHDHVEVQQKAYNNFNAYNELSPQKLKFSR